MFLNVVICPAIPLLILVLILTKGGFKTMNNNNQFRSLQNGQIRGF